MIGIRVDPADLPPGTSSTEIWISDWEFEAWVRSGKVGPETLVWMGADSGGEWRRAEDVDLYHLFRTEAPAPRQSLSLRDRLLPPRGFSALELLVMANLLVAGALLAVWRDKYSYELAMLMRSWHGKIEHFWDFWITFPTLFIHANAGHLFRNLLALAASAGAVEVFFGKRLTAVAYFVTGLMGALFSYYGHSRPPLSVGASGAIFGLGGVMTAFLFRFYPRFNERQRWKTRRIYAPLFLFLIPPSLFQADYWAHGGGFLMGILLGLMLPLSEEGEKLLEAERLEPAAEAAPLTPEKPEPASPADAGLGTTDRS
jgi:membrane associated rhomboid family serine protease